MTVKELIAKQRGDILGCRIKIMELRPEIFGRFNTFNEQILLGQAGTLTNDFDSFEVRGIGVFLDGYSPEYCNLDLQDEVELI